MLTVTPGVEARLRRRSHTLSKCWRIRRTDSQEFRFTDHCHAMILEDGQLYTPAGGGQQSARSREAGLVDTNCEFVGILTDDRITFEDLHIGKYDDAQIDEFVVDFRVPWAEPLMSTRYWIDQVEFDGETWKAQLSSLPSWLQTPVGRVCSRGCDNILGDSRCRIDLTATGRNQFTNVTTVITQRVVFDVASAGGFADDDFALGSVTFNTGLNANIKREIKQYTATGRIVELFEPTPFDITVGDTVTLVVGCDGRRSSCNNRFSNMNNYGGFPSIPGTDRLIAGPG